MTTDELRKEFLIQNIFKADDVTGVYSHVDRIVTLGAMPVKGKLDLSKNIDPMKDFGVNYFLERRELGMINIGGDGVVEADGVVYDLVHYDGLYLPKETKEVFFPARIPPIPQVHMSSTPPTRRSPPSTSSSPRRSTFPPEPPPTPTSGRSTNTSTPRFSTPVSFRWG